MHAARTLAIALATLAFTACSSAIGGGSGQRVIRYRHNVISFQEITSESASSAYDLVERLRPYFLRGRTVGSFGSRTLVYMDDTMYGDVASLRTINARDVLEIRYVRGEEMIFRTQEASGNRVIQVITRRN